MLSEREDKMSKGRILVVDDEISARSALSEILTDEGFKVRTAADGFRALAAAGDFAPDLVLTDLKMPGMDGLELLGRLKEHDPEVAVVLMTAFGAVESAVEAMRAGAADYLTKPLNSDELLLVLERCHSAGHQLRQARPHGDDHDTDDELADPDLQRQVGCGTDDHLRAHREGRQSSQDKLM